MPEPLDLDVVEQHLRDTNHACIAWGLVAELRATRAERDEFCAEWRNRIRQYRELADAYREMKARAERAEAEVSRLRECWVLGPDQLHRAPEVPVLPNPYVICGETGPGFMRCDRPEGHGGRHYESVWESNTVRFVIGVWGES